MTLPVSATGFVRDASPTPLTRPESADAAHGFRDLLARTAGSIAASERALDAAMGRSLRAPTMDSQRLLQLQAEVYRYSELLDFSGKVVEKATQAVRQTLQSQT